MAKTKGIRALEIEKQRQEAEAKQRKELQVSLLSDTREDSHAVSKSKPPLASELARPSILGQPLSIFMHDGQAQHYSAASVLYAPSCKPPAGPMSQSCAPAEAKTAGRCLCARGGGRGSETG